MRFTSELTRLRPQALFVATALVAALGAAPASAQFGMTEVSAPGSATPFLLTKTGWSYESIPNVTYNFYRQGPGENGFSCIHFGETQTTWAGDPMNPGAGEVFYYLVTAHDRTEENLPGAGSDGTPRNVLMACPAPTPVGACCDGLTCTVETEADCLMVPGRTYAGDNTDCNAMPSPCTPTGACCDGSTCTTETEADCLMVPGRTYAGDNTDCNAMPSPCAPTGACCGGIAGCSQLTEADCMMLSGSYAGDNTDCNDVPDPCTPTGACCDGVGDCFEATQAECDMRGGIYSGDGTVCGGAPDPCACGSFTAPNPITWSFVVNVPGSPVDLRGDPSDPDRIFVVEQSGAIFIVERGAMIATPFLDIAARVRDVGNEQGLLGLAFHPQYPTNGLFYVYYTSQPAGEATISEFRVTADPNVADRMSERILLTVGQPAGNHNGGCLAFSPQDGYLYIGTGDGGAACDNAGVGDHAQNLNGLLGKMIRIDIDNRTMPLEYAIPADNPFVGGGGLPEIWSYGLRNPWRFSFDALTADMYIGDVGQGALEEVDFQPASSTGGENWGWVCMEGTQFNTCGRPQAICGTGPDPSWVLPITEYVSTVNCSITGGYVYRGAAYPQLRGHYFYADFCSDRVWSIRYECGAVAEFIEWTNTPGFPPLFNITTFGEDANRELYIVSRGGDIYRTGP